MIVSSADGPRWTPSQRLAIETRDVSVSLSAGAGCGKTFVLIERYLAHFRPGESGALRPDDLHELLAITFTERAAREMRDRIRRECYRRLSTAAPSADSQYWSDLVRGLDNARISTIHAYCAALLRSHAVEAGLDPRFEVLEQAQAETLLSEALDDELRERVAQRHAATFELAARFDLYALRSMVRVLAIEAAGPELAAWLLTPPDEQVVRWASFFETQILPEIGRQLSESSSVSAAIESLRDESPRHATMRKRRNLLLEILPRLGQGAGSAAALAADLRSLHEHARVQGGGSAKSWSSPATYETFKSAAEELRKLANQLEPLLAFDSRAARSAAEAGHELLQLAAAVRARYTARKAELAALDFDDLLARARDLLADPQQEELRGRLSSQLRLLLVDEFQDTDRVQNELVQALCGSEVDAGKLFVVGDYKQSIYRFRGADPGVFRQLRERTPAAGRLSLVDNFRSQPAVLEFVNGLFCEEFGEEYEPLVPHRTQTAPRPAVEFLWASPTSPPPDIRAARRTEAEWIARRIRAMLDGSEQLIGAPDASQPGGERPRAVTPGDIAILFRALSDVELYENELRRYGIEYYLVGGHAFYAQQEIFDLLNLLRAVASPSDTVSLAGALRSPLFALADETLFWLAQHPAGLAAGLFAAELPRELSAEERPKVLRAARTLSELRDTKDRLRISELIERAMALTGYDAVLLAEFLGERKLANLRKVIEQARTFERGGAFRLVDFIAELTEFVAGQPKEPLAATLPEDTNVVRLMTIHQAKGLEFPVVFVADLDRVAERRGDRVHYDAQLGPLVLMPDDADGNRPTSGYEMWRFLEQREDLAELYRLLYVATTRAADYLVLSGCAANAAAPKGPWMQLLARRFDLATGEFLGAATAGANVPHVRVTKESPAAAPARGGQHTRWTAVDQAVDEVRAASTLPPQVLAAIGAVAPDATARRQYSFSRLSGGLHVALSAVPLDSHDERAGSDTAAAAQLPAREEPGDDALALGRLVHAVLAAIDWRDPGDWRELIALHAERQFLRPKSPAVTTANQLLASFVASPRAVALAQSPQSLCEAEFQLAWPLAAKGAAPITLTGYIDRLDQDPSGRWHLLDFKTNRVTADSLARVAAAYEMQMLVYALAAEQILGAAPASVTLHFLRGGLEHPFAWDAAARKRAISLVERAIANTHAPQPRSAANDSATGGRQLTMF
ncbi:MAG: UvrD-helicase domain-containing protein [Pirellulales bacterium]